MQCFVNVLEKVRFGADKLCKTNLFETTRMFCDLYGFEPGQAQSSHVHEASDKVYYVIDGKGVFRVGDEERTVGAGHAVFVPAGRLHAVHNLGPSRLVVLVFMAPKP